MENTDAMTPDMFVARLLAGHDAEELAVVLADTVSNMDGSAVRAWIDAVVRHPDMNLSPIRGVGPWDLGVGLSMNPYVSVRVENGSGATVVIDDVETSDSRQAALEVRRIVGQDVYGAKITVAGVEPNAAKHPGFAGAVRLAVATALNDARGPISRFKSPGFEHLSKVNGEACKDPRFRAAMSRTGLGTR
jgi:hypothetical protein